MSEKLPSSSRYAKALAVLRIYTGLAWCSHGFGKLASPQWAAQGGWFDTILKNMSSNTSGPYHDFVYGFVLPHANVFAALVAWGESLTGIALVLGLFTRLGGIGGAFLALNYWAAKGDYANWNSIGALDLVHVALSLVNVALPTGLVWGLDGLIAARKKAATTGIKS